MFLFQSSISIKMVEDFWLIWFFFSFFSIVTVKFLNGKLYDDTEYAVFQRSFASHGDYENEGFITFKTKKSPTAIIVIAVSIVVVLIILLLLTGAVVLWRRSRGKGKS